MKKLAGVLMILCIASWCRAGLDESLGNARTNMSVDADRSDWGDVIPYVNDSTNEAGIGAFDVDWRTVSLAHTPGGGTLFIRYEMNNGADFNSFPAFYNIYADTDHDRNTGYIGGGSQFPLGADYLIQGVTVFSFAGASQTDFSWTQLGAGTFDNSYTNLDIEIAIDPSLFGSPSSFDFLVLGDNSLNADTEDYYPDSSNTGADGGYFRYTFSMLVTQPMARAATVGNVTGFQFTSQDTVKYELQYATNGPTTNWVSTGYQVTGNGSNVFLYDPTGYSTAKTYRVAIP